MIGSPFFTTKYTKATKEMLKKSAAFPPFVYLVSVVFNLFPVIDGRAEH
jgi:hypothetical protein